MPCANRHSAAQKSHRKSTKSYAKKPRSPPIPCPA
jgi:hypothetical protein